MGPSTHRDPSTPGNLVWTPRDLRRPGWGILGLQETMDSQGAMEELWTPGGQRRNH